MLPKTYKKINLSKKSVTRNTKPKPFSLSKSNYNKNNTNQGKSKQFKARKMPDLSIPFIIFKNDKELTTFKEFNITT